MTGEDKNAVQCYFQSYPGFVYEPSERAAQQFSRLVKERGWRVGSHEFFVALAGLNDALLRKFETSSKSLEMPNESVVPEFELDRTPELEFDDEPKVGIQEVTMQNMLQAERCEQEKGEGEEARKPSKQEKRGTRKERKEKRKQERVQAGFDSEDSRQIVSTGAVSGISEPQPCASNQVESNGADPPSQVGPPSPLVTSDFDHGPNHIGSNYLDAFFGEFSDFNAMRDRTLSVATQLGQLRKQQHWWGPREYLWSTASDRYYEALVLQFNAWYGTDTEDLKTWHRILWVIGDELPSTVKECKKLAGSIHVNIVDLVDASIHPGTRDVDIFESVEDLSQYTIETKKFFPQKHAEAGGVLRYLLREIL